MKFMVSLDRDVDGIWIAECPSIPGCVSQGETRDEAITNIKDAIHECVITWADHADNRVNWALGSRRLKSPSKLATCSPW